MSPLEQIQHVEQRLLDAMLTSNLGELDALLSDELLVTGPDGQLVGKADDLAAHRAGVLQIKAMVPLETTIKLLPEMAIVFALMEIQGSFQAEPFVGRYRYTRVWTNENGRWQIIAAHISPTP
jgi:ketosteroid isomerase-like protein